MGLFNRLGRRAEERAEGAKGVTEFDSALLRALLVGGTVTKQTALQVPAISGGVDLIAGIVAGTPVKLYEDGEGRAREVTDDPRIRLLNDETGDILSANEFWRAMVRDYYLGKGAYAYIRRERGRVKSLHYVDEEKVSILMGTDPVFKDYDLMVEGRRYRPHDFLKILRNTKDGARGVPITEENSELIAAAYQGLLFEKYMAQKGGNKKGYLISERRLGTEELDKLRGDFSGLYGNTTDNVVVLNAGLKFQESSNTAAELQVNENKQANGVEFARIFHVSPEAVTGKEGDSRALAKLAALPLMQAIQSALNRDLLLEREKGKLYWAFDVKELLKGDMRERFEAYRTALDSNFMQIDEVRYAEDLEPLGLSWIKLGLQDVLYDPRTKQVYTPNTNQTSALGGGGVKESLSPPGGDGTIEESRGGEALELRYNKNHDAKRRFASGAGGVRIGKKEYTRLCHQILTDFPNLKPGDQIYDYENRNHRYRFSVNDPGSYTFYAKAKIGGKKDWGKKRYPSNE